MSSKLPSHLMKNRHGIYYLRLTDNGKEKRKSLHTKDIFEAKAAAFELGHKLSRMKKEDQQIRFATLGEINEHEAYQRKIRQFNAEQSAYSRFEALEDKAIEDARFQYYLEQNPHLKPLAAPTAAIAIPAIEPTKLSITIEEAIIKYKDARANDTKAGTQRTWKSCYNKLLKTFKGRDVRSISHEEITYIIVNPIGGKSPDTISKDVGVWSRVFEWLKAHKLVEENPVVKPQFRNVKTRELKKEYSRDYAPFDNNDIKILFSKKHLSSLKRPEDPWLQLIGLCTGARLESIARIKVENITCCTLELVALYDKQFIQRILPIHPLLIKAGLHTYVSEIEEKFGRSSYLFTEMNEISNRRSHAYSMRFSRQRKSLGIKKGKVFHSLRSNVISAIDKNGGNGQARRLYVGHKQLEKLDVEEMSYLKSKYTPEELSKAIFPYIQWQIEDWKYTPKSALKQIAKLRKVHVQEELQTANKETVKEDKVKPKIKLNADRKKRREKQQAFAEKSLKEPAN